MLRVWGIAIAFAIGGTASAQETDILLVNTDGQIDVGGEVDHSGNQVLVSRAFNGRFNSFYAVNNPGFAATAGDLPGSARLDWDFLPMSYNGLTSNLLYWDGAGDTPDFGEAPAGHTISLFGRDNEEAVAGGESSLVPGATIDITASNGAVHQHHFFFIDDNGDGMNSTLPDAGYYLIAMRARLDMPMSDPDYLERSDPFYIVWGTPDSDALTQSQVARPWVGERVDTLVLPGDHNFDGFVDAADYTVWRDGFGVTHSQVDVDQWVENYGAIAEGFAPAALAATAPEPTSACLLTGLLLLGVGKRR